MRVDFGRIALRFLSIASVAGITGLLLAGSATAGEQIFDELRFGVSTSVQSGHSREDGVFPEITALFDPFGYDTAVGWQQQLLHPRVHLGTSIGTSGEATQFFTGFTWTVDFNEKLFAEAGFGGVIHTGDLEGDDDGPELGCRVLFHEYLGTGYRFNVHWNVMAQIAHSSHANLCEGPNDGMTRAGLQVGYKF
ncbi:acyloxyacyl hydrolase [Rhizobium leguminosarum]|uniref:acyloxyacyl hydrolase n=1 Tax=Rhizobium leguminosarum TaxID=384 RepID=UPI001C977CC8|nr:acyloxyacyl hydrolase [Rhizobium leguminosarum]MBY5582476.1 acyloxyacyl hydrolase [Rhizobium leguminosarum]MBY5606644.1 acyloxyacyl hydrolase [Rhizobium leguminosarum]MBY5640196.1 acyloxyacyl hydrolase [Rhizobium leguminosarum]MBY5653468.1 acyloxyacyl hydrolase [Rhizobium leguminosarum]MBY5668384.1 acyloxyacyl hydrolase [Rhizobium leguminosarum]